MTSAFATKNPEMSICRSLSILFWFTKIPKSANQPTTMASTGFSFSSPAPTFGSATPAATPGVQTPTSAATGTGGVDTNTAAKSVKFSFASTPTFSATAATAATPTTPAPATGGGGFSVSGASPGFGGGTIPQTPGAGVQNPLLHKAGFTPGLSRGSSGGGASAAASRGAAASAASFLFPTVGGIGGSNGRVTFAEDDGVIGGGGGLRRRRGGAGDLAQKENHVAASNILGARSPAGFKPPPKASLWSSSAFAAQPMEEDRKSAASAAGSGEDSNADSKTTNTAAAAVKERALVPASAVPLNTNPWSQWVLVFGHTNGGQLQTVLNRFGTYGTILSRHAGSNADGASAVAESTNWVCLKYETYLQAEKALCQHGTFLDGTTAGNVGPLIVVGVMRMDAALARTLGLASPEGGIAVSSSAAGLFGAGGRSLTSKGAPSSALLGEDDILIGGGGDKNVAAAAGRYVRPGDGGVCEKVLSWVFMW